jgi:hypothetical protein
VIRFTVPDQQGGVYLLESAARGYLVEYDAEYHVVVNGVEVFSKFLPTHSATGYTNTLTLGSGNTVDFICGRGADGEEYGSGLDIQAKLTRTEPPCAPRGARAATVVMNGFVIDATISDGGCGYSNAPLVKIVGGGGSGATATAMVSNGVVVKIGITDAGIGYTGTPTVQVASPPLMPWLDIAVSKVRVTQHVVLGRKYIFESSKDLTTWTQIGKQFTAEEAVTTQEFDVDATDRLFRIREVP